MPFKCRLYTLIGFNVPFLQPKLFEEEEEEKNIENLKSIPKYILKMLLRNML